MAIDLKEIEALIKLCRKQGVTDFSCEGVSLKLGEEPVKKKAQIVQEQSLLDDSEIPDPYADFPEIILNEEQLTYYANGGKVGEEPWVKQ